MRPGGSLSGVSSALLQRLLSAAASHEVRPTTFRSPGAHLCMRQGDCGGLGRYRDAAVPTVLHTWSESQAQCEGLSACRCLRLHGIC